MEKVHSQLIQIFLFPDNGVLFFYVKKILRDKYKLRKIINEWNVIFLYFKQITLDLEEEN